MFRRRRNPTVSVVLILIVFVFTVVVAERALSSTIVAIAKAKAVQTAVLTVNGAVRDHLAESEVRYQDLVHLHKDRDGRIVMMQANTIKINELAAGFALASERAIADLERESFSIPLGQMLGSQLLASYGPGIPVRIIPVGAVEIEMVDRFEAAGINQTRHRIYLDLGSSVRIVVPWQRTEVQIATRVPLVENIIVGEVPDTFVTLDGGLLGAGFVKLIQEGSMR
ncbi:MAG: sporulation protein YunB [Clostridia bacterium]|nr:sporulation protein YunB [Clostridia bacterium]